MFLIKLYKIDDGTDYKYIMQDFKINYEMLEVKVIHESTKLFLFDVVEDGTHFIVILF